MFKGILTMAVLTAMSVNALAFVETRVDRNEGRTDVERAAKDAINKASASNAARIAVLNAVKSDSSELAKVLVANPNLGVIPSVEVYMRVKDSVYAKPLAEFAVSHKNNPYIVKNVTATFELGSVLGMDKIDIKDATDKILQVQSSEPALNNLSLLTHFKAAIMKAKKMTAVSVVVLAEAIARIRTGSFIDARPEDLKTARELEFCSI